MIDAKKSSRKDSMSAQTTQSVFRGGRRFFAGLAKFARDRIGTKNDPAWSGVRLSGWVRLLPVLERSSRHVSAVEKDRCGWFDDGRNRRLRHDAGIDRRSERSGHDLDHARGALGDFAGGSGLPVGRKAESRGADSGGIDSAGVTSGAAARFSGSFVDCGSVVQRGGFVV